MESENLSKIIQLRHELHMHPELAGSEVWTKNHLINFLKENTKLQIVDRGLWFYVYYHYNDLADNLGFVADFDALAIDETIDLAYGSIYKGKSHKCGHDGHAASLCGLCLEVDKIRPQKNIYFIFQHGEEVGMGGKDVSLIVEEKHIDEIYKIHNANYHQEGGFPLASIVYTDGINNCASYGLNLKFFGKNSHASLPEDGKNPVFAMGKIIKFIEENTKLYGDDLLLCTIVEVKLGDKNFGKNPGFGEMSMTIRAKKEEKMKEFIEQLFNLTEKLAKTYGLRVEKEYSDYFPEVYNHKKSVEKIKKAAKNLAYTLIKIQTARSSEDFGYYTKLTKGAYFMIGNGEDYPKAHTVEFDYNDKIIEPYVEMCKEIIRI
ncbi:MAG: amidohydrolase [Peptoniphilaceae bacterium]|nr:amidohydrolase [Peptoniphilaceae bacterium]MDY6018828.1 amidohydrolase [Anaerococcus sp.]